MKLRLYQVDAFTDRLYRGNPAAVCPLPGDWLPDETMIKIAAENNLPETAFYITTDSGFAIRWFTPMTEVDLCGHATLATSHVIFNHEGFDGDRIVFDSRKGALTVTRRDSLIALNFPFDPVKSAVLPDSLISCFDARPESVFTASIGYVLVFRDADQVRSAKPDLTAIAGLDADGVIITAPGDDVDFVSRCFFPKMGIDEDPVTGAAHTALVPYWAARLGKKNFVAKQLSARSGSLYCRDLGDRVEIAGHAVTYLAGEITI